MNPPVFFDELRKSALFGGRLSAMQTQGINGVLAGFAKVGDGRPKTLAYGLATVRREVGAGMCPVREGFAKTDAEAREKVADLARANPGRYRYATPIDGRCYYGRGYVQLTWLTNYQAAAVRFGIDLVGNPDLALDPTIAARILFWGIQSGAFNPQGHGIAFYLPDAGRADLMGARRTVNLTDHWQEVAGHYSVFMDALDAAGFEDAPEPAGAAVVAEDEPRAPILAPAAPEAPEHAEPTDQAVANLVAWRARAPEGWPAVLDWLKEMP